VRDLATRTWTRRASSPRPIHEKFPGKLLAYNCSPSFNWKKNLDDATIAVPARLGAMGYKFQFVTLAGFHALNTSMFELALAYRDEGMAAYSRLQEREFELEAPRLQRVKHQRSSAPATSTIGQDQGRGLPSLQAIELLQVDLL
jgi:isocitrate lyase